MRLRVTAEVRDRSACPQCGRDDEAGPVQRDAEAGNAENHRFHQHETGDQPQKPSGCHPHARLQFA